MAFFSPTFLEININFLPVSEEKMQEPHMDYRLSVANCLYCSISNFSLSIEFILCILYSILFWVLFPAAFYQWERRKEIRNYRLLFTELEFKPFFVALLFSVLFHYFIQSLDKVLYPRLAFSGTLLYNKCPVQLF